MASEITGAQWRRWLRDLPAIIAAAASPESVPDPSGERVGLGYLSDASTGTYRPFVTLNHPIPNVRVEIVPGAETEIENVRVYLDSAQEATEDA